MSGFTPFVAANVLTAAQLNALLPIYIVKGASESVTSSTTFQNDDELAIPMVAGRTYAVKCCLIVNGATAGDIKTAWTTSGTITLAGQRVVQGPGVSVVSAADTTAVMLMTSALTNTVTYGTDGALHNGIVEEFIVTCTVSGTLTLQWAQATSSGTATTVGSGSWILATPIS